MNDLKILKDLRDGNHGAFKSIYDKYYRDLVLFAGNFIPEKCNCEDMVQSLFLKLWNDKQVLSIDTSLRAFLLRSVRNACLDELKHRQVMRNHEAWVENITNLDALDVDNYILYSDLKQRLDDSLNALPSEYAVAFKMNRFEGLKYKEIAEKLAVSERTIQVRIGKALSHLRTSLKDFLVSLLLMDVF